MSDTKIYGVWEAMLYRCRNSNASDYEYYGGRGIEVCKRWLSFENFLADMGKSYKKGLWIDRIDNNGNYCPGNCRWTTPRRQGLNRNNNRFITHDGLTLTLSQWVSRTGIPKSTIRGRLKRGWSVKKALTLEPVVGRNGYFRV
jgi:hypothetical protein